jgi:hypothetical protein
MPSSATITAFYTFSANAKARASQVNNNFDTFRGHIIPVHVSTVTSANNTYDLGSTEYRWRNSYLASVYLGTTTTSFNISQETTTGEILSLKKNGTTVFNFSSVGQTTSANYSQIGVSAVFGSTAGTQDFNFTAGSALLSYFTIAALTIKTSGQPVVLSVVPFEASLSSGNSLRAFSNTTTQYTIVWGFRRNGNAICWNSRSANSTNPLSDGYFIGTDFPDATTSCSYEFGVLLNAVLSGGAIMTGSITRLYKFYAKETL